MKEDRELKVTTERNYVVAKANTIIQKARYSLNLLEQKTFCYAISKIKPNDKPGTEYTFSINDYCDVCGIDRNNGKTIENVKKALKSLRDKSFYFLDENGNEPLIGWLGTVEIKPQKGKITITFDNNMQKYLMKLGTDYTQYSLLCILPMKSNYSPALYEILRSHAGQRRKHVDFDVNILKKQLCAPYVNFKDFRVKVLEPTTREINLYTDIGVTWEPITQGRKVIKVRFFIEKYNSLKYYENSLRATDELDKQMNIFDYQTGENTFEIKKSP